MPDTVGIACLLSIRALRSQACTALASFRICSALIWHHIYPTISLSYIPDFILASQKVVYCRQQIQDAKQIHLR